VIMGRPGGESHAPARRSVEAITGGSGRVGEEVSATRRRGGKYDAPRPGCNYRTHSTFFLTHSIPNLSNEGLARTEAAFVSHRRVLAEGERVVAAMHMENNLLAN